MPDTENWERQIIEAGRRELLKRHHPDRAGKDAESQKAAHQASVAINSASSWLLEVEERVRALKGQRLVVVPPAVPLGTATIPIAPFFHANPGGSLFEQAVVTVLDHFFGEKKRPKKRKGR